MDSTLAIKWARRLLLNGNSVAANKRSFRRSHRRTEKRRLREMGEEYEPTLRQYTEWDVI